MDADNTPLAYRVADACRVIGLGRSSIYKLIKAGKLKPVTIAGRVLIPAGELRRLLGEEASQ